MFLFWFLYPAPWRRKWGKRCWPYSLKCTSSANSHFSKKEQAPVASWDMALFSGTSLPPQAWQSQCQAHCSSPGRWNRKLVPWSRAAGGCSGWRCHREPSAVGIPPHPPLPTACPLHGEREGMGGTYSQVRRKGGWRVAGRGIWWKEWDKIQRLELQEIRDQSSELVLGVVFPPFSLLSVFIFPLMKLRG